MNNAPEWTKPYIVFQCDDGTWYVPWNTYGNANRHRQDVERDFGIVLQVCATGGVHGDWETRR